MSVLDRWNEQNRWGLFPTRTPEGVRQGPMGELQGRLYAAPASQQQVQGGSRSEGGKTEACTGWRVEEVRYKPRTVEVQKEKHEYQAGFQAGT